MSQQIFFNFKLMKDRNYDEINQLFRNIYQKIEKNFRIIHISNKDEYENEQSKYLLIESRKGWQIHIEFKNRNSMKNFPLVQYHLIRIFAAQNLDLAFILDLKQIVKVVYKIINKSGTGSNELDYGDLFKEGENENYLRRKYAKRFDLGYWSVNLFSPEDVQKYDKEKLLNSPCELIEEWEDGAIFMMIHKDSFSSTYEERKKLREYLGEKESEIIKNE